MTARNDPRGLGKSDRLARMEEMLSRQRPGATQRGQHNASPRNHDAAQWLVGILLWIVLVIFLLTLGAFVATRADTAERILAQSIPQLTELDGLLALHAGDLQTRAQSDSRSPVNMPEFPVQVTLPAGQVAHATPAQLEGLIAQRAAEAIYQRGPSAFALGGAEASNRTGPFLSSQWVSHQALDMLNARTHGRISAVLTLFAVASLALAVIFCWRRAPGGRLVALGFVGSAGALGAALICIVAWAAIEATHGATAGTLGTAAWGMVANVAWVAAVVGLFGLTGFAAITLLGYVFARFEVPERKPPAGNAIPAGRPALEMVTRGTRPLDRLPKPPPPPSN
jgi:hypothetical protein